MGRLRMEGRKALITGAGSGIGAATAFAFCREGAAVLMVDQDQQGLVRTLEMIKMELPDAQLDFVVADVADTASAESAVFKAGSRWGILDTLVNNAAMRNYSTALDATPIEWQAIVAVNLVGMSNFCKAAIPMLRQSGRGSIVNVSSCYAVTGRKGMALYDATKAAQLAYTRSLAFEEAPHGIRANAVCPGSTLTAFHIQRGKQHGKSLDQIKTERKDTSLLSRWATPEEIAAPILWLASDEGSYITGTTLMVDGGLHVM